MIPFCARVIQGRGRRAALRHSGKLAARCGAPLLAAWALIGCVIADYSSTDADAETEIIGRSVEGRPIHATMLGSGPETCLLFGAIHGNEPLGAMLLERLTERLAALPELLDGKRVVIVPVLNPDGLARSSRTNARGVDLNRNFPASNFSATSRNGRTPASEPETRALLKLIRRLQPSRILSIHSPLHCVNYDGPAEELARDMANATGYPLRESIGYATPGSLGSYAGEDLQIPTITLELAPRVTEEEVWPEMASALEGFVTAEVGIGN